MNVEEIRFNDCLNILKKFSSEYGIITNELEDTLIFVYGKKIYDKVLSKYIKDEHINDF